MSISLNKYRQAFLVLLFCLLGFANKSYATHYAAVDLFIDFVGTDSTDLKYKVTLDVYKSCEYTGGFFSADLGPNYTINYTSSCTVPGSFVVDTIGNYNIDTLDQLCSNLSATNLCHTANSIWPSFIHIRYTKVITLPTRCSDYLFSWTNGSRNNGISNLCSPGSQNIFTDLKYNNLRHYNNSSPRFSAPPIPYFCINVAAPFYNVPVDPDGNLLYTINYQPRGCTFACGSQASCAVPTGAPASSGFLGYAAGYTLANPIASSNGYVVNPNTGNAFFSPTLTGKFVLALRCYEIDPVYFDTIGYISRDVQVSVLNCNSGPPTIDPHPDNSISAVGVKIDTNSNTVFTCANVSSTWSVSSQSAFNSNNVTMTATVTPASSNPITYTVVGQNSGSPTMVFNWTPNENQVDSVYYVDIISRDSTCNTGQPVVFKSYTSFTARVIPSMQAGADRFGYCALNNDSIQLRAQGADIINISYNWMRTFDGTSTGIYNPHDKNPKAITNQTTSFVVFTDDMPLGCKNSDTMVVNVDNSNSIDVTSPNPQDPYVLCRPGYINLDAEGHGNPPASNIPCGASTNPACANPETMAISVPFDGFPASKKIDTSATPFRTDYKRHQFLLKRKDLRGSGLYSGTLTSLTIGGLYVKNNSGIANLSDVQVALKCTTLEGLQTNLEGGMTNVYSGTGAAPISGTGFSLKIEFTTPYNWDTTQNLIVEICYSSNDAPVFAEFFTADYKAHNYSATCATATPPATIPYSTRVPRFSFGYCSAPGLPFEYTWHPGVFVSDSTIKQPTAYIPDDMQYFVTTKGRNGCLVIDSFSVYVPTHNFDIFPKDTSICFGETVPFRSMPNKDNMGYKWYEVDQYGNLNTASTITDDTDPTPIAKPTAVGDFTYAVVMTDSVYCSDTLYTSVNVRPLPAVKVLNNDTTIKYGSSIRLIASGASLYTWSPVTNLTDPNLVNPIATPTEPTLFQLYGIGSNGCRNHDSVFVYIDYRGQLFIPTAFTPNGDGKNDKFGLVNLSFQKIIEFRIFNRWGQEVFSTIDSRTGWDGRWKGVEQPMGAYNYIIRVGYPDGFAETYKGDITLIR